MSPVIFAVCLNPVCVGSSGEYGLGEELCFLWDSVERKYFTDAVVEGTFVHFTPLFQGGLCRIPLPLLAAQGEWNICGSNLKTGSECTCEVLSSSRIEWETRTGKKTWEQKAIFQSQVSFIVNSVYPKFWNYFLICSEKLSCILEVDFLLTFSIETDKVAAIIAHSLFVYLRDCQRLPYEVQVIYCMQGCVPSVLDPSTWIKFGGCSLCPQLLIGKDMGRYTWTEREAYSVMFIWLWAKELCFFFFLLTLS